MQANEVIYVTGMSVSVGLTSGASADLYAQQLAPHAALRKGRIIILSSDAPEWAMVTLGPPRIEQDAGIGL